MTQKIKAASALFNDTVINGDSGVNAKAFDGLEKAVTGSTTEFIPTTAIDLSDSTAVDTNYKLFLDLLDEFLMGLDGTPSMLAGNTKLIARLRACARRSAQYTVTMNEFGQQVERYGAIPFVDLGTKAGTNDPVSAINGQGETSLYAVRFGMDGFHGVAPTGNTLIKSWLPDYKTAGAVKTGEVEMVAAVALKATKAAGIYAPNENYSGSSAGVTFVNGVGETDNPYLIDWFKDHGYEVDEESIDSEEKTKKTKK